MFFPNKKNRANIIVHTFASFFSLSLSLSFILSLLFSRRGINIQTLPLWFISWEVVCTSTQAIIGAIDYKRRSPDKIELTFFFVLESIKVWTLSIIVKNGRHHHHSVDQHNLSFIVDCMEPQNKKKLNNFVW